VYSISYPIPISMLISSESWYDFSLQSFELRFCSNRTLTFYGPKWTFLTQFKQINVFTSLPLTGKWMLYLASLSREKWVLKINIILLKCINYAQKSSTIIFVMLVTYSALLKPSLNFGYCTNFVLKCTTERCTKRSEQTVQMKNYHFHIRLLD